MSSSRSRSRTRQRRRGGIHEIRDGEIKELVSNLQNLLPHHLPTAPSHDVKVSAARIVQETCNYIRSLRRQVDELSDTLSALLETTDTTQADIIITTTTTLISGSAYNAS